MPNRKKEEVLSSLYSMVYNKIYLHCVLLLTVEFGILTRLQSKHFAFLEFKMYCIVYNNCFIELLVIKVFETFFLIGPPSLVKDCISWTLILDSIVLFLIIFENYLQISKSEKPLYVI